MTPEVALQLIDQALANLNGTRSDHATLQNAIRVIKEAIEPAASPAAAQGVKDGSDSAKPAASPANSRS